MSAKYWVLLLAGFFLAACGGPADEAASDDGGYTDEGYAEEEDEGVFDPLVGTIDRAEGVQDANLDRKAEMDAALEETE